MLRCRGAAALKPSLPGLQNRSGVLLFKTPVPDRAFDWYSSRDLPTASGGFCEEETFVTANATSVPLEKVGASVSVFTSEDLEARREPMVANLLRTTPGAMVVQTGAPGGVTSLFVRGGESSYNKVLIDGIPINEPGQGRSTSATSRQRTSIASRWCVARSPRSTDQTPWRALVQLFTKRANPLDPRSSRVARASKAGRSALTTPRRLFQVQAESSTTCSARAACRPTTTV